MTKSEMKARIRKALEALGNIKDELDDMKSEAECTYDEIEPYEGRNDLTEAQEERQEWFESVADALGNLYDDIEERQCELEELL